MAGFTNNYRLLWENFEIFKAISQNNSKRLLLVLVFYPRDNKSCFVEYILFIQFIVYKWYG